MADAGNVLALVREALGEMDRGAALSGTLRKAVRIARLRTDWTNLVGSCTGPSISRTRQVAR